MKKNVCSSKVWSTKVLIAFLLIVFPWQTIYSYSFKVDGIYYLINDDGSVAVTYERERKYNYNYLNTYSGDVVIPSSVSYNNKVYEVKSIGNCAFYNCSSVSSIEIPNRVTSIGDSAFWKCSSISSIEIPNSVTSIGSYAFHGCSSITSIEIPNSVTSIGSYAFYKCKSLTEATILDGTNSLSAGQPFIDTPIEKLYLGRNMSGLQGIETLKKLIIGNCVTSLSDKEFEGCTNLTEVIISDSKEALSIDTPFNDCPIEKLYLGRNIKMINTYSYNAPFREQKSLKTLTIGDCVTSIEEDAFKGCSSLTEVTFGNSVTSIGEDAFSNCSSLTEVTIPNSVTSINSGAFYLCGNLTKVAIPNSVTSIGSSAFAYCKLTEITIPNSVTYIGASAFYDCSSLKEINILDGTQVLYIECYYQRPSEKLYLSSPFDLIPTEAKLYIGRHFECPANISPFYRVKTVIIGDNLTTIDPSSFERCSALKEVIWGKSVENIGSSAFKECRNLTELTIPNSIKNIDVDAFRECTRLTELIIGNNVTSIKSRAFQGCSSLTSIISLAEKHPSIAWSDVFNGVPTNSTTVYVPASALNDYKNAWIWKDFGTILSIEDDVIVNEKILSKKRTEALETYETAMTLYEDYMSYYNGDGMESYRQTAEKQESNRDEASSLLCDIELLEKKLSESGMADDDTASYTEALNAMKESVATLKAENGGVFADNSFLDKVLEYYENVAAYNDRLAQYKESVKAAIMLKELDSIIAEIEKDAKNVESSYLQPVIEEYSGLEDIAARLVQIGKELEKCKAQILSCSDGIVSSIESMIADRKANANDRLQHAMTVYEEYMSYYDGEGMEHYIQTAEKQEGNSNDADSALDDIEILEKKLSESGMAEEDTAFYTETLNAIKENVTTLKDENDKILADNSFHDKVLEYYENVAAFNGRLVQYKESVEAATMLKELDSLVAEIEKDAKNVESSYLQPVVTEYQKLEDIETRLVKIGEELETCKSQLQTCSDEIDSSIGTMIADKKANANEMLQQAMAVYEDYMSYYNGDGMEHYKQTAEKQESNSDEASSILGDIELLEKKLSESGMADEDIASYTETLNAINEIVNILKGENDNILADNSFHDKVLEYYENVVAFNDRLAQYKESAEAATTLKELDSIIAEIEKDAKNVESSYLQPIVSEYQKLEDIETRLVQIGEELKKCKAQIQGCSDEIDAIITEIATVVNTESEYIIVYTLNGLPYSVKKDELMSLPKGIYIVNGKKVLIK